MLSTSARIRVRTSSFLRAAARHKSEAKLRSIRGAARTSYRPDTLSRLHTNIKLHDWRSMSRSMRPASRAPQAQCRQSMLRRRRPPTCGRRYRAPRSSWGRAWGRAWGSCLICLSFCLLSASWLPDLSFILSAVCFVAACSVVHYVCCLLPLVLYCWCCVACSVCCLLLSVSCGVCVSLGCVLLPAVSHACCSLVLPALLCARPVRRFCPRVFLVALVVLSRLHLFLACISSWSVSRRCWSVSRRISLVVCHWSSCCCAPCPVLPLEFVCSARRVRPVRLASFVLPGQFRVLPACVC